jgi:hypothetical protein
MVRGGDVTETPDGQPSARETTTITASGNTAPNAGQPSGLNEPAGQPPQIDLAAAAQKLGVTEAALGVPAGGPLQGGQTPTSQP